MAFKKRDQVEWHSQAGGKGKVKRGEIVLVVPANKKLSVDDLEGIEGFENFTSRQLRSTVQTSSATRNHESYIVAVEGSAKAKKQLYWPLVKHLEPIGVGDKDGQEEDEEEPENEVDDESEEDESEDEEEEDESGAEDGGDEEDDEEESEGKSSTGKGKARSQGRAGA